MSTADFKELLAILDLSREDDDLFIGSHPSKNPIRTFGGQMMAQAFVAAACIAGRRARLSGRWIARSIHLGSLRVETQPVCALHG